MPRRPPLLARPISPERLVREFEWVRGRGPVAACYPKARFIFDAALEEENRRNPRRFASCEITGGQTRGGRRTQRRVHVYFAPQVLHLPWSHRLGLIAHELGHLILLLGGKKSHTERDADMEALHAYGVSIAYDRRWPGKGLQAGALIVREPWWSGSIPSWVA